MRTDFQAKLKFRQPEHSQSDEIMKKVALCLLFSLLLWNSPAWACGECHGKPRPRKINQNIDIQVEYNQQKKRTRATFIYPDKTIAAVAEPVMPDFPHSKIVFFDKKRRKIGELHLTTQNSKLEYFTLYYPNGQKMFHDSKQQSRQMWDKTGAKINDNNKTQSNQFNQNVDKTIEQIREPMQRVLQYLEYNR